MTLASVRSMSSRSFVYTPPDSIFKLARIVLVPGASIKPDVMLRVLRGLWRMTPTTRIVIIDNGSVTPEMLGSNMRIADLSELPLRPYGNAKGGKAVVATSLLHDVDGCITLASFDDVEDPAKEIPSLAVLSTLTPGNPSHENVFNTLGQFLNGTIVDIGDKVIWGDDFFVVEGEAYQQLGTQPPKLLDRLK